MNAPPTFRRGCKAFPVRPGEPRATLEHMPFKGHRNCAQWGPTYSHVEWCPPEHRKWYRHLLAIGFSETEARDFIENDIRRNG